RILSRLRNGVVSFLIQKFSPPFFFHAEDGIRVLHVTGVQTCALPISEPDRRRSRRDRHRAGQVRAGEGVHRVARPRPPQPPSHRSEERRVGEEARSWWWP